MSSLPTRRVYPWLRAAATALTLTLLVPGAVRAADYGTFVDVENEEDLLDLLGTGEIDETTFGILLELLHDGVNLNSADREDLYSLPNLTYGEVDAILAYRADAGAIHNPTDLVAAGALSDQKLVAIAGFLVLGPADQDWSAVHGRFRYGTTYVTTDDELPSMWLGARISALRHLEVGAVGALTRTRLGEIAYDPNRDALSAEGPAVRAHLPKYFLQWETDAWHLVAGTYRIGFGQRLTFDNTDRYTPNGIRLDDAIFYSQDLSRVCRQSAGELVDSPCAGAAGDEYRSPDYRWSDRLRGLAVGVKALDVGAGWLQGYAWASYQTHGIYQYEIYDRDRCDDPTDDDDPVCKAPDVYRRQGDLLAPTSRFSYSSLPDMYNELIAGGNVGYHFDRRTHIGLTGYGADVHWLVEGLDLDFQEWSRTPYGGPYGAVGLDGSWGWDLLDLFLEVTRSIDSQPAGGGWAGLVRGTVTWQRHEFELAARFLHPDFANPYARPISAADEFDGLRSRDEAGVRLHYTGELITDLQARAGLDLWSALQAQPAVGDPTQTEHPLKLRSTARVDYRGLYWFTPGVWFEYQDKNLAYSGRDNCYEIPFEETPEDEPVPCAGEKLQAGVQLRFQPHKRLGLTVKYQHRWLDDGDTDYDSGFREDLAAWFAVRYTPIDALRLAARVRYLNEAVDDDEHLEDSVWFYFEVGYAFETLFRVKVRYELYAWLDQRSSTDDREPNPAHWLRAELEVRF